MITPMKKLSILCLASDTETTLDALRELGVLHVTPCTASNGATADDAHRQADEARMALTTLDAYHQHPHASKTAPMSSSPDELINAISAKRKQHRHEEERLANLRHVRHSLKPYGQFSPDTICDLAKRGITVKLYHARDLGNVEVPDDLQLHILSEDKSGTHFALIGQRDFTVDAAEFHVPKKSLNEVEAEISTAKLALGELNDELASLASERPVVEQALHDREEAGRYADVHDTVGRHGAITQLQGYCPDDAVDQIRRHASELGWGLQIEEPSSTDDVPTLLKLPRWVTPIKAVLSMLSILPGYREADISAVFLVFFSIFFAILIGDAGYGFLFLVATLVARKKKPNAPAYPFVLFGILSIGTIIWGALTGNYFGINPEALPGPLQGVQVKWLTGDSAQSHVMQLCFLIGAAHLTIAHVWNGVVYGRSLKTLAQVGWIGLVWSMYFTALNMVLQHPLPALFVPLILASVALILLFMTPLKDMKKDWINHAMFPLTLVNCFVDIVSYIRLFAVGLASLSVAQSFNDMALQIGWSRLWTIPIMALILLAGHGLNIILCALGILVHGVRLNTLEFCLHKNLEWKGTPYQPFARVPRQPQTNN
jgi:V/A-type H+/Na+-transporting ATPase subunit I